MKKTILLVAMLSLAGCATQTYYVSSRGPVYAPTTDMPQSFLIGGLGQEQELDAGGICGGPNKVAKVQSKVEATDWFVSVLTAGIYTPRHAKVFCIR